MTYHPRVEFVIGLLGLAICGLGIGLVTADVLEKPAVRISTEEPTTTTTMINSSVIVPETTTTIEPASTTVPGPVGRVPAPVIKKAAAMVANPSSTTTTTESPETPLEVAMSQLGKTGPYAEGGFWCAKFVRWTAEQAHVEGFISRDGPSALYADAVRDGRFTQIPSVGDIVFIDLFGPDEMGHGQVTHVGIVETINGDEIQIVQGNGKPDPTVITRTTYELGDGYIVGFAPFTKAAA
jgi:hypothetical protein